MTGRPLKMNRSAPMPNKHGTWLKSCWEVTTGTEAFPTKHEVAQRVTTKIFFLGMVCWPCWALITDPPWPLRQLRECPKPLSRLRIIMCL